MRKLLRHLGCLAVSLRDAGIYRIFMVIGVRQGRVDLAKTEMEALGNLLWRQMLLIDPNGNI